MDCCERWKMQILPEVSLEPFNTLALPGRCRAMVEVNGDEELREALAAARAEGLVPLALGEGSNIVLAGDLDALVIRQQARPLLTMAEDAHSVVLRVSAGENWHKLVASTLDSGLQGLENLALIPGCVGAAPVQNIGAYGVELEAFIERVHGVGLESGERIELDNAACEFRYRDSIFKHELRDRCIITAVDIRLPKQGPVNVEYPALSERLAAMGIAEASPRDVFEAVVAVRQSKLPNPAREPNAGSFFKNPELPYEQAAYTRRLHMHMPCYNLPNGRVKVPAAWLIEQCGWKGKRRGSVGVHPGHALVLVHYGGGRGEELLSLAEAIRDSVEARFHVRLEMEPRVYGAASDGI